MPKAPLLRWTDIFYNKDIVQYKRTNKGTILCEEPEQSEEQASDKTEAEDDKLHPTFSLAVDQREVFAKLKSKFYLPAPTHYELLPTIFEDEPIAPSALPSLLLEPQHVPVSNVALIEWENDIAWGDESTSSEEPCPTWLEYTRGLILKPLTVDWADDAVIWDCTRPCKIPIPRLHISPFLPNLTVPVPVKTKNLQPQTIDWRQAFSETQMSSIPIRKRQTVSALCHSVVATSLQLIPWQMNEEQARHFHRPKHQILGSARLKFRGKYSLVKQFGIQKQGDLSAADNLILILEYSEQNPPIIQNVGMASKLRHYYSQSSATDVMPEPLPDEIGEAISLSPTDAPPFLGKIPPGERMYGLENHLFKGALFSHPAAQTDFLLCQTLTGQWFLRDIPHLFIVGQILPLEKVPTPSGNVATNYSRNRLVSFVKQLLRQNPRILLADIREQFPNETEPAIRKVLKAYCEFQRSGEHGSCWILKNSQPGEAEPIATPEQVCLNESSQANLVRLKDMGIQRFNNSYALTEAQDLLHGTKNEALTAIEAEVQLMPWNSGSTFCDVMRGRLRPSINNAESVTNDQFAFAKSRTDARIVKEVKDVNKVTRREDGSDLRKVSVKDARRFLIEKAFMTKEEVGKIRRWDLIDLIREKATELAEEGEDDPEVLRYARRVLPNPDARQNEFQKRAQNIYDRMVQFCRGTDQSEDLDRFEQELLDLIGDAAEDEAPDSNEPLAEKSSRRRSAPAKAGGGKKQKIAKAPEVTEAEEVAALQDIKALQSRPFELFNPGTLVGTLSGPVVPFKMVRKVLTTFNSDGSRLQKTEFVRDPVEVEYILRKKRNLEQKRSNIGSMLLQDNSHVDPFFQQVLQTCQAIVLELRDLKFPKLSRPKQGSISLTAMSELIRNKQPLPATSPNMKKPKVRNSLWYSNSVLETDPADSEVAGTPIVRCGLHAPQYRSYCWRKNGYTRLDPEDWLILRKLQPAVFSCRCQFREFPGGPICGRTYVQTGSMNNQRYLSEIDTAAGLISDRIIIGEFLPEAFAVKAFS